MENKFFSASKFGEALREMRRAVGYRNTKSFSEAIEEQTGVFIDKDTLFKLERGERLPDVEKYYAIVATLSPRKTIGSFANTANNFLWHSLIQHDEFVDLTEQLNAIESEMQRIEAEYPMAQFSSLSSGKLYAASSLYEECRYDAESVLYALTHNTEMLGRSREMVEIQANRARLLLNSLELMRETIANTRWEQEEEQPTKPAQ